MGGLKTYFAMLALLGAHIGAAPAWASGGTAYQQFATCAGRLSAEIEHLWLLPGPDAQAHAGQIAKRQAQRDAMVQLMQALAPAAKPQSGMAARLNAKFAHKALLTRATFNPNTRDARLARTAAHRAVAGCTALLLS